MAKAKAGQRGPSGPPAPTQAPPSPGVLRRWRVEFPWSPTLVLEAATEADAWAEYRRRCHILDTPHQPKIDPLPFDDAP